MPLELASKPYLYPYFISLYQNNVCLVLIFVCFCQLNILFCHIAPMSGVGTLNPTAPGGDTSLFPWWDTFMFEEAEEDMMNNWEASDTKVRQLDSWFHPHATGRRRHTEYQEQMVSRHRNLLCHAGGGAPGEHAIEVFLRCTAPCLNKILPCFTYFMSPVWWMIARCSSLTFTGCLSAQHEQWQAANQSAPAPVGGSASPLSTCGGGRSILNRHTAPVADWVLFIRSHKSIASLPEWLAALW